MTGAEETCSAVTDETAPVSSRRCAVPYPIANTSSSWVACGVNAKSTYCYLLAAAEHRDADTWRVHLLDASQQGLNPDYTIADAGQGPRAGQKAAWGDKRCHGDVFHIQH